MPINRSMLPHKRFKPMKRVPLRRIGKKGLKDKLAINEGDKVLRELGIFWCELHLEGCMGTLMLSRAHRKKRRFCDFEELKVFCLSCQNCHNLVERMSHDDMFKIIDKAINERNGMRGFI